ncbi:MAG: OmpA family protein [Planctomycetota bacterium]
MKQGIRIRHFALLAAAALIALPSCASTNQDEGELDREVSVLREENQNLRRRIDDVGSVEGAYEKELKAKSDDLMRARSEADRLRGENTQLRGELAEARKRPAAPAEPKVQPAVHTEPKRAPRVDVSGLAGPDVDVVDLGDGKLRLRLGSSAMFALASSELTAEGKKVLDRVGDVLRRERGLYVSVEGHTDATPLGKSKAKWGTNMALSMARALVVQDYLKANKGIAENRMRVVGYGEHRPVVSGGSKEALARNRRVELVLSSDSL